ncbi:MAG: ATP-binding cassette domain-containing protein [Spirochaetia bacterium]|jgi:polar amino acid transport system ATP-binding protein|nr:ATP-binding cassette domain-containing protein [Spirochaetia bacterium]
MNIEIKDLAMQFPAKQKKIRNAPVLKDVCFKENITTMAIIGPSGGGKSTLIRILAGLQTPTGGSVKIGDTTVFPLDATERDNKMDPLSGYRKKIGFVFQNGGLFKHLTGFENIELPLVQVHGYSPEAAHERAVELLGRFGLLDDAGKLPANLSGGQQQRISIARAISAKPSLLYLDEPTSALDPEYTVEVLDMVNELKEEGLNFIIVTHEMGFARRACDTVAFLDQGTLMEYGKSEQIFTQPATESLRHFLDKLLEWEG